MINYYALWLLGKFTKLFEKLAVIYTWLIHKICCIYLACLDWCHFFGHSFVFLFYKIVMGCKTVWTPSEKSYFWASGSIYLSIYSITNICTEISGSASDLMDEIFSYFHIISKSCHYHNLFFHFSIIQFFVW